jgi:hypothetical protein
MYYILSSTTVKHKRSKNDILNIYNSKGTPMSFSKLTDLLNHGRIIFLPRLLYIFKNIKIKIKIKIIVHNT